ncbi:hypothetical protein K3495_g6779 [Podosphaera aphanis]|nr:hypothetical protein K3495_g6779 [Podosphaera aphanis]
MTQIKVKSILGSGVSFPKWRSALQAKLGRRNVLGHVFHNIRGIRPRPEPATPTTQSEEAVNKYQANLEECTLGDIEAKDIIIDRIVPTMCPNHYDNMTAKELYDTIAYTRQETASAPYTISLDSILDVKMTTTADAYIDQFQSALQNVKNAADTLSTTDGQMTLSSTSERDRRPSPSSKERNISHGSKRGEQPGPSSPTEDIHRSNR